MTAGRRLGALAMTALFVLSGLAPVVGMVGVGSAGNSGTTGGSAGTWSAYQANPERTGSFPQETGLTGGNVDVAWTASYAGDERTNHWKTPVVSNETVIATTGSKVYGFNESTGATEWVFDPAPSVLGDRSPTVDGGLAYVVTDYTRYQSRSTVVAIDTTTGLSPWNVSEGDLGFTPTSAGFKTVTAVNGTVYATTSNYVVAINATTHAVEWEHEATPGRSVLVNEGPVTVDNGTVYFSAVGDVAHVYALDAADGSVTWSENMSAVTAYTDTETPLVKANGHLYYTASDGSTSRLFGIDVASRTTTIDRALPNTLKSEALAVTNDHVYLAVKQTGVYGDELVALDADTGGVQWSYAFKSGTSSGDSHYENAPPIVVGSDVYVVTQPLGTPDHWNVTAVDTASGTGQWSERFELAGDERVDSPLAYDDGRLFVAGSEMHAIADAGGSTAPNVSVAPSTVDVGGVAVDGSAQDTIVVENTGTATLAVTGTTLGGADTEQFGVSNGGSFTLAPSATRTLTVTYAPTANASHAATLSIASNDTDEPSTVVDLAGTGLAPTPTPTPTPAPSNGNGGGGGGDDDSGGGPSTSPPVNVDVTPAGTGQMDVSVENANAGDAVSIDPNDREIGSVTLDSIDLVPAVDGDFTLTVGLSETAPPGAPTDTPTGDTPLSYLTVDHSIADRDVEAVTFEFWIDRTTLADRSLEPSDVVIYRYHDGTWQPASMAVADETTTHHVFEATVPGLSVFVVGSGASARATPAPTGTATSVRTETGRTAHTDTPGPTNTVTGPETTESTTTGGQPGFSLAVGVIAVLLVLGGAGLVMRRR